MRILLLLCVSLVEGVYNIVDNYVPHRRVVTFALYQTTLMRGVALVYLLVVHGGVFGVVEQVVDPGDSEKDATLSWVPLAVYVRWHVLNGGGGEGGGGSVIVGPDSFPSCLRNDDVSFSR